jgi:hypothetical protein
MYTRPVSEAVMTETQQQIMAMLDRKKHIEQGRDRQASGGSYHWLCEAVELLLRIELQRQQ